MVNQHAQYQQQQLDLQQQPALHRQQPTLQHHFKPEPKAAPSEQLAYTNPVQHAWNLTTDPAYFSSQLTMPSAQVDTFTFCFNIIEQMRYCTDHPPPPLIIPNLTFSLPCRCLDTVHKDGTPSRPAVSGISSSTPPLQPTTSTSKPRRRHRGALLRRGRMELQERSRISVLLKDASGKYIFLVCFLFILLYYIPSLFLVYGSPSSYHLLLLLLAYIK